MCPNHPEQIVDALQLKSASLTQRVQLWDDVSGTLDQDEIKTSFFQRCHRANPPFRRRVKLGLRSRVRVPKAIKEQYSDPPDLLPPINTPLQLLDQDTSDARSVPLVNGSAHETKDHDKLDDITEEEREQVRFFFPRFQPRFV